MSEVQTNSQGRAKFNELKSIRKKNFNMFIPGFFVGLMVHRMSKKLFTLEHFGARPWSAIFTGLFIGSLLHYYTWKKRLNIESSCIIEELRERQMLEKQLTRLKAGSDLENTIILNYLKNTDKF